MFAIQTRKEIHDLINELPDKHLLEVLQYIKHIINDATIAKHIENIIEENKELFTRLAQ
ncbi:MULTISPECIES: hypothetical protein [unclassified Mucilaginibacter]|uniref:hypothetical protein n=1 Tax=unclassified Mucilaginibacter TaxID=2617802 RepID=UPI002AC90497|nr:MULTISPECIES: hypothetical protein [unclassified Mucilaginibacter]MEB0249739.1 hypothetical protein [Mucilaginibacter sp. 5B2]MEB0264013.1 hypothetical protein [Mucilaginibacter sp. 10I4]MEB0277873.1 hypothetical protein [Mucilaginibacter sp. 10B2]MEB0300580.1 hypothetical protein [Mucilaginibacter sp. 5C4]WPX22765.1 hypothetical protein RHM67_15900 [Mucilaginibacter sp. 5C4]